MKADLMLQMQVLTVKTFTFYHEQNNVAGSDLLENLHLPTLIERYNKLNVDHTYNRVVDLAELGGHEENICLGATEQDPSDQSKDTESDNEESCEKELEGSGSDTNSSQAQDKNNGVNEFEQLEMPPRSSLGLGKYLRKKIPNIFKRQSQKPELFMEDIRNIEEIQEIQKYKFLINFKRDELVKATANFTHKIGSGAFGTVYRGILSDGREVAVKILRIEARQGETEWMSDLQILTKLRHRNIVELVGYCHEDMMLVYDYFPRNLSTAIFDENEIFLDWSIRQRIILDIIRGLAYLHESAQVSIVHRGIKPNNILLDENWKAKICDFGLARIMQPDDAQYTNKGISADCNLFLKDLNKHPGSVTSGPPGTISYLDPEYDFTGCLNAKSDIYSFGLTLLDVVSGKGVVELKNALAWRLYKEDQLHELIDPRLLITGSLNSSSILRAVKIALWCTQKEPERRPLASRVLAMLLSEEDIRIPLQGIESYFDFCPSHKTSSDKEPDTEKVNYSF